MRKASDEPLRKVTLKLFEADDDFLKSIHGWGYTTVIRAVVRAHCLAIRKCQGPEPEGDNWGDLSTGMNDD